MLLAFDVDDAMFIISLYCGILASLFNGIIMKKRSCWRGYGESWLCGGLFDRIMVKRGKDMSVGGKVAIFFTL